MKKPRNPVVRAARTLKAGVHQKTEHHARQNIKQTLKNWQDEHQANDSKHHSNNKK